MDVTRVGGRCGLVGLPLLLAVAATAQTYTAIDLGILGTGASPSGINSSGQIVGSFESLAGLPHAFLSANFALADLGTLSGAPSTYSVGFAVNNRGQVVGESEVTSGTFHAFQFSNGSLIDLDPVDFESAATGINSQGRVAGYAVAAAGESFFAALFSGGNSINLGTIAGGSSCQAEGLNDNGQVVGFCNLGSTTNFHAFLYNQGTMTDLNTAAGLSSSTSSEAFAINNRGQVVGFLETASGDTRAFLYAGGVLADLGAITGYNGAQAFGINNSGQVVGYSYLNSGVNHAFLWSGGLMIDLNNLVALPNGAYLVAAAGINDSGQIAGQGSDGHTYLLNPAPSNLTASNPFASYASSQQAPQTLTVENLLAAPPVAAQGLAADGESAVVLVYRSKSPQSVTFSLTTPGTTLPAGASAGSLAVYDPNFLVTPRPASGVSTLPIATPNFGADVQGYFDFVALLWAPAAMPVADVPVVPIQVTATQHGQPGAQVGVNLEPPPLLLVHGIWSSAAAAGFTPGSGGFNDYLVGLYPHNLIFPVDYGSVSSRSFADPEIQNIFSSNLSDALAEAAQNGMAAREVDVVAHSMGGLVTRYFLSNPPFAPDLLSTSVHDLITVGTPHQGSALATVLVNNASVQGAGNPEIAALCGSVSPCTLGAAMNAAGRTIAAGASSLEPGSTALKALLPSTTFDAMAGTAPTPISTTETILDLLVGGFLSGQTLGSILGSANDTVVTTASQDPAGAANSAAISAIVSASLCGGCDVSETAAQAVWRQAFYWLTGGTGMALGASNAESLAPAARTPGPRTSGQPAPVLNLSGYTQVAATNVSFQPASGATLTINSANNITATSATKTIREVLLLETVVDPADTVLWYATASPFSIAFTPTRTGTATFGAITVFNDNTYTLTGLNYTLQPSGAPYALHLLNLPVASLVVGSARAVAVEALYSNGPVNVTQAATYATASGGSSVFSAAAGGTITANGAGVDTLTVSYGGVTASAPIVVGSCTYALSPANQIVAPTGGSVSIQVTTQSGCAWTAGGGASWLVFTAASGSGSGAIQLSAAANGNGTPQSVLIAVGGATAIVTQPATACSYSLSQNQINVPAAGGRGSIAVTSSCPVIAVSNQSWLAAMGVGSSVSYTVSPNSLLAPRSTTLTIGTVTIPVMQAGFICAVKGTSEVGIADVQQMVNEVLGASSPANDVNGDRAVNVVDMQIVIDAALGLGCGG